MTKKKKKTTYRIDEEHPGFYNLDKSTLRLFEKGFSGTITKKETDKLRKKLGG
jgi:hypothetical protein